MIFFNQKKLTTLFFILGFLFFSPFAVQANNCTDNGGLCTAISSCSISLDGGAYDTDCDTGQICCSSTKTTTSTTSSEDYTEGSTGGFLLFKGHLVPCGRLTDDSNTNNDETKSCTLCHLFILLKNIFDLMLSLIIVVAILMITIGGIIYIISTGNPSLTGIAKNIITKTLIGFALMLTGWLLVFTLLTFLSTGSMVGKNSWFEFTCNETSLFDSAQKATLPDSNKETSLNPADNSDYTGLVSQMSDASPQLVSFLNCMKPKLSANAKEISSISDSYGINNCIPSTYTNNCAHAKNSCHYGGKNALCIGKSYAVDFANEAYQSQINSAALSCNPKAYVLLESNHVHVSIGSSFNCGCN